MEKLSQKTLSVSRGYLYTYYTRFLESSRGTILLLHGWPDTASVWNNFIIDYLTPHNYNVIAPDCLGYGDTSKPLDEKAYDFRLVSRDLVEILDNEGVERVICLGHDWGTGLACRLYNFYPSRISALALSAGTYFAPMSAPFDLDALIAISHRQLGYGSLWYWKLFTADDGAEVLNSNVEGMWTVLHARPETWLDTMCAENAVRDFLLQRKTLEVMPYATEERKQEFVEIMSKNGFEGPLRWYRSLTFGVQDDANRRAMENNVVNVPFLFVGGDRDLCCRVEDLKTQIAAGLLLRADIKVLKGSGHWCMLSDPTGFGDAVLDWLNGLDSL